METKGSAELVKKLIKAKSEMGAIKKDSVNPFFKSKYADLPAILAEVEPALLNNGLIVIQPIEDGKITTIITDGNESITSSIDIGNYNKPQDLGSAITYYRRYALQSLLSLSAEDDDGNRANKGVKPKISKERFDNAISAIKNKKAKITDLFGFSLTDDQKEVINNLLENE